MKHIKLLRILGIAVILSLLLVVIPAAPALAYTYDIDLDPTSGAIGDEITITGTSFDYDTYPGWVTVYFAADNVVVGKIIDTHVDTYAVVAGDIDVEDDDDEGSFATTFEVPSELNEGDDEEDVTEGTYYIYVTKTWEDSESGESYVIKAKATFTVTSGGEITLDPKNGTVGTEVEVSGESFPDNETITIKFDSTSTDIASGDEETDNSGDFTSYILIPETYAGSHTIAVTASTTVSATFTVKPEITLSATSGTAGSTITVSGTGFAASKTVTITLGSSTATATTDTSGAFSNTSLKVPGSLAAGSYTVSAVDASSNTAVAKITVQAAATSPTPTPTPTSLSLSETSGAVGGYLMLGGAGFQPNATVSIKYDNTEIAKATVQASGLFASNIFQVPASKHGTHTITVSDGTHTNNVTFTVESVAPDVPTPLLPEKGGKAKSPASFSWEAVTDNSSPVTYALQISTAKAFSDNASLMLNKTEIAKPEYTLTEAEESKLIGEESPYYWRVRAIDAAQNASEWTAAREFSISTPFKLVESPTPYFWAAVGVGAIILLLIGYLIGKRTAYNY